jgi:heterodisulfide reductase subunit A-like polyferredoxin
MIYEKTRRYIIPFDDVPTPRAEMPEISVDERRGSYREVETGFSEDVAVREAKRCLSCRRCLGCALCWAECKPEAIDFSIPHQEMDLQFDDVVLTRGQDNAFSSFNPRLGFGDFPHVITDLQFERMLSPYGPTGGVVMSSLDGEIPGRIAIVQGNADGDDDHLLSSMLLGVNEAILALDRTKDLQVTLVSPVTQAFQDRFLSEAENVAGLTIVDGSPTAVENGAEQNVLTLTYARDGEARKEDFHMVVVLTKPKLAAEIQSLSKKLDQKIL